VKAINFGVLDCHALNSVLQLEAQQNVLNSKHNKNAGMIKKQNFLKQGGYQYKDCDGLSSV
jgi:hypothetical protein